jgi:hypothetical protein
VVHLDTKFNELTIDAFHTRRSRSIHLPYPYQLSARSRASMKRISMTPVCAALYELVMVKDL